MNLLEDFQRIRGQSTSLCASLSAEDMTAQSMADASPAKWHLAHTSWFFETFILLERGWSAFNPHYQYLFNSYYNSKGDQYFRPQRGLITRPGVEEVLDYRRYVDEQILSLLDTASADIQALVEVGLHHEMQHQELMLTDILHLFSFNPLHPVIMEDGLGNKKTGEHRTMEWFDFGEALVEVGAQTEHGFAYDCECPRHKIWLTPFTLASRLITNAEWQAFMTDGGYSEPLLWLSEGWACKQQNQWQAPEYWRQQDGRWMQYGLTGLKELQPDAPVCHISYFEAHAYAHWAGKRLPREHELEFAGQRKKIKGNFLEAANWRPRAADEQGLQQLYGDAWEWTGSAYLPYPGFQVGQGALGEYNGKFMCGQFVLRGGSCVTPKQQMRPTYRNFFYPWQRWQFTGLRLAQDL